MSCILSVAFISSVDAINIFIENPSFENPYLQDGSGVSICPGWEVIDLSGGGTATAIINPSFPDFYEYQMDGRNILYAHNGEVSSQMLSAVLEPNKIYTLTVLVGHRRSPFIGHPDFFFDEYAVQLFTGDTLLVEESSLEPDEREFLPSTSTYIAYDDNPLLGEFLEIRLMAIGKQAGFDNVILDVTDIPDPVRVDGATPVYFINLQAAYDHSVTGDVIQSQSLVFNEDIVIDENKSVTLIGGYNLFYTNIDGKTILNGSMLINGGSILIENFSLE